MSYSLSAAGERTIVDYISNNMDPSLSCNFYRGLGNDNMILPACKVILEQGEEYIFSSNIFRMNVAIEVRQNAKDTADNEIGILSQNIFDMFQDPARAANFSNSTYGFYTQLVRSLSQSEEIDGDCHVSKYTLEFFSSK